MRVNILSLDGGGMLALSQAVVLAEIERLCGPLSKAFDLIAGTSAGGINALMLAHPAGYSAEDVASLYVENGQKIFHRPFWRIVNDILSVIEAKYPADGIESVLKKFMGSATMSEATTNILIPATDVVGETGVIFRRDSIAYRNTPMWQAARATSAAPTYFPAFNGLVDGGLLANDPSACALGMARDLWGKAASNVEYFLVSIGTGSCSDRITAASAAHWGIAGWLPEIVGVILKSDSSFVQSQVRADIGRKLVRINDPLPKYASAAIDDASAKQIEALKRFGRETIENNRPALSYIQSMIAAGKPSRPSGSLARESAPQSQKPFSKDPEQPPTQ